ncbi:MAG: GerMN domain-containing protein [Clostridiales bacterium]|nr:GerMN domain-containing protein [Clostridiales bacterium]MDY2835506.1 GerMN domain-containing protein [Candidatus Aphodomonas sp.]
MAKRAKKWRIAALLLAACLLGGCAAKPSPQGGEISSALPTVETAAAQVDVPSGMSGSRVETREVALYFRARGEDLLARETRKIYLSRDERLEKAIVRAIIDGPSASLMDLSGTFNPSTQVLSVFETGSVLNVTLSRAFLSSPTDVPSDWYNYASWREEVLMRRMLSLAAVTLALTDASEYTAVQFLAQERADDLTGKRILRREIYFGETDDTAVLGPMTRDESLLLTQYNSAQVILECWRDKDFARLYRFIAQTDGERPTQEAFVQTVSDMPRALIDFSVQPGSVSEDGQTAVMTAELTCLSQGDVLNIHAYPMHLLRENGLWKISYAALTRMMEAN